MKDDTFYHIYRVKAIDKDGQLHEHMFATMDLAKQNARPMEMLYGRAEIDAPIVWGD